MGKVLAVCISEKKGTQKKNVGSAVFVEDWGLEGDAHAGKWHRQVSLLSGEKIDAFRAKGAEVEDGAFGENLVVEGIDFAKLPVGTRFRCGEVVLELTQIGKECHNGCAIFQKMGECIMPREGVFTRVLKGGKVSVGDEMTVDKAMILIPMHITMMKLLMRIVLTCWIACRRMGSGILWMCVLLWDILIGFMIWLRNILLFMVQWVFIRMMRIRWMQLCWMRSADIAT